MGLKDLLVLIDASKGAKHRLRLAAELARRHEASLTGLYIADVVESESAPGRVLSHLEMARLPREVHEEANRLEKAFWDEVRRDNLLGEWRVALGPVAGTVALHARYADLAMLGQIDPSDPATQVAKGSLEQVLLSTGRPVLVIPYDHRVETIGEAVLIGWKPSREAARAVNDAIPILQKARSVTVLAVNPERGISGDGDLPAADAAHHLARHGIKAIAAQRTVAPAGESDLLLEHAAELGADLLVIGGYGHLTQSIMGGVTRALLQHTTLPVLLSH